MSAIRLPQVIFQSSQRSPETVYAAAALDGAARSAPPVEGAGESGHISGLDHSVGEFSYYLKARITYSSIQQ